MINLVEQNYMNAGEESEELCLKIQGVIGQKKQKKAIV